MRIRCLLCALALSLLYGLPQFSWGEEKVHMRATVKGQRVYLADRQAGIAAIMEFTRQKDRDLSARVYDDHMKTIARDGTISQKLQRIVIERSKRFTGVTREVRPQEIFDFSFLQRAQAEVTQSGWTP